MNEEATDQMIADVERGEAWLAKVMERFPEPECGSLEQVRLRVRIAAQERAMAFDAAPAPTEDLLRSAKRAIRAELDRTVAGGLKPRAPRARLAGSRTWEQVRIVVGSLAVAAALTFALLPWSRTTESGPADKEVMESVALFATAVESVSADDTDASDELWTLSAALEDLEDQGVAPADSWFEEEVGDLEDDIDRLLSDDATASDV